MTRALHNFLNSYLPRVLIASALILSFFVVGASHAEEEEQRILRAAANSISMSFGRTELAAMARNGNCFAGARLLANREPAKGWDLKTLHDCGLTFWNPRSNEFVQDLAFREDKGEPISLVEQARKLGFTAEAEGKLRVALDAGNARAGVELSSRLRLGVLSPPDPRAASEVIIKVLKMLTEPDRSYRMMAMSETGSLKFAIEPARWIGVLDELIWEIEHLCKLDSELVPGEVFGNLLKKIAGSGTVDQTEVEYLEQYVFEGEPGFPRDWDFSECLGWNSWLFARGQFGNEFSIIHVLLAFVAGGIACFLLISLNRRNRGGPLNAEVGLSGQKIGPVDETVGIPRSSEININTSIQDINAEIPIEVKSAQRFKLNTASILVISFFVSLLLTAIASSLEMNPAGKSFLLGIFGTLSGGLFGYLIKILLDSLDRSAAVTSGNYWAGWVILAASMSQSSFFSSFEAEDLVRLIIAIVGAGGFAFVLGWGFAKIRSN